MSAGAIEKNVCTSAKNERPTICWRTCSAASRRFSSRYRSTASRCRSKTFASSTPETDNVSSVMADSSASDSCVDFEIRRRTRPTRQVRYTNTGTTPSDSRVSCHDSATMAIAVLRTVTVLERTDEAVFVTTFWTPPTSFCSRDWSSPVRVAVKKRSDIACRCS